MSDELVIHLTVHKDEAVVVIPLSIDGHRSKEPMKIPLAKYLESLEPPPDPADWWKHT